MAPTDWDPGQYAQFGLAAVTVVPPLVWLYVLVNRNEWAQSPT